MHADLPGCAVLVMHAVSKSAQRPRRVRVLDSEHNQDAGDTHTATEALLRSIANVGASVGTSAAESLAWDVQSIHPVATRVTNASPVAGQRSRDGDGLADGGGHGDGDGGGDGGSGVGAVTTVSHASAAAGRTAVPPSTSLPVPLTLPPRPNRPKPRVYVSPPTSPASTAAREVVAGSGSASVGGASTVEPLRVYRLSSGGNEGAASAAPPPSAAQSVMPQTTSSQPSLSPRAAAMASAFQAAPPTMPASTASRSSLSPRASDLDRLAVSKSNDLMHLYVCRAPCFRGQGTQAYPRAGAVSCRYTEWEQTLASRATIVEARRANTSREQQEREAALRQREAAAADREAELTAAEARVRSAAQAVQLQQEEVASREARAAAALKRASDTDKLLGDLEDKLRQREEAVAQREVDAASAEAKAAAAASTAAAAVQQAQDEAETLARKAQAEASDRAAVVNAEMDELRTQQVRAWRGVGVLRVCVCVCMAGVVTVATRCGCVMYAGGTPQGCSRVGRRQAGSRGSLGRS